MRARGFEEQPVIPDRRGLAARRDDGALSIRGGGFYRDGAEPGEGLNG
jgi:hypothetical protein